MENIIKTYPSGLRLVVRHMPNFKSVATSVYIGVGSRDELDNEHGLSHFVEHMLFKGTTTRSAEQIAQTLSSLGVEFNAYTSNNATCYHTRGLNSNVDTCCEILSDMYFNMKFADDDFAREAEVIVQEIAMRDDNPQWVLSELCMETFFAGTPYGHNIAGTVESVRGFRPADIYNYTKKHYTAPNTIIAFAGDITLNQAEELLKTHFESHFSTPNSPHLRVLEPKNLLPKQAFAKRKKDTEQHNVAVLFPVCNNIHPDKYKLIFVNEIMSADMSSRLFTSVRDKLGLVYNISGGLHLTNLGGYYYIWFSCTEENTELVLKTIDSELKKLLESGVTQDEINKVKNIKCAERLYEAESVEQSNQRNAAQLAEYNEIETAEQFLGKINAVTAQDVLDVSKKYLNYKNAIVAIVGKSIKIKPFEILH